MKRLFLYIWAAVLFSTVASAARLTVTTERLYSKTSIPGGLESYTFSRRGIETTGVNAAVYLPLSVLVQNPDTSIRTITADLLKVDFDGHIHSLGRRGNIDALHLINPTALIVQTGSSLSRLNLATEEEVWKRALPASDSRISEVLPVDAATFLLRPAPHDTLEWVDVATGKTNRTTHPDALVGRSWELLGAVSPNHALLFNKGRYSLVDELGLVFWNYGAVYPELSYGSSVSLTNGQFLFAEYISAQNPDPALRRRTALSVVDRTGTLLWTRTAFHHFLAEGAKHLYLTERDASGKTAVVAVSPLTGQPVWRQDLPPDVSPNAVERGGYLFLAYGGTLQVFDAISGVALVTRHWLDRRDVFVRGIQGKRLVLTSAERNDPHQYYLSHVLFH